MALTIAGESGSITFQMRQVPSKEEESSACGILG
jgi:hypothetical protein